MHSLYNNERLLAMPPSADKVQFEDWLILAEDGRHVLLGRHRSPTEEDISRVAHALAAQGLGGWLALGTGNYYEKTQQYSLQNIMAISKSMVSWEIAETRFYKIREDLL